MRKTSNAQNRAPAIREMRHVPEPKGRAAVASPFGDLNTDRDSLRRGRLKSLQSRGTRSWLGATADRFDQSRTLCAPELAIGRAGIVIRRLPCASIACVVAGPSIAVFPCDSSHTPFPPNLSLGHDLELPEVVEVLAYIEKEDTPRSLPYQLELLRQVGFSRVDVLHKNGPFAAFGGCKE